MSRGERGRPHLKDPVDEEIGKSETEDPGEFPQAEFIELMRVFSKMDQMRRFGNLRVAPLPGQSERSEGTKTWFVGRDSSDPLLYIKPKFVMVLEPTVLRWLKSWEPAKMFVDRRWIRA